MALGSDRDKVIAFLNTLVSGAVVLLVLRLAEYVGPTDEEMAQAVAEEAAREVRERQRASDSLWAEYQRRQQQEAARHLNERIAAIDTLRVLVALGVAGDPGELLAAYQRVRDTSVVGRAVPDSELVALRGSARAVLRVTYRPLALAAFERVQDYAAYAAAYQIQGTSGPRIYTSAAVLLSLELENAVRQAAAFSRTAEVWAVDSAEFSRWRTFWMYETEYLREKRMRGLVTESYADELKRRAEAAEIARRRAHCARSHTNWACGPNDEYRY